MHTDQAWHISGKFFKIPHGMSFESIQEVIIEAAFRVDQIKITKQISFMDEIDDKRAIASFLLDNGHLQVIHVPSTGALFIDLILFNDWKFSHAFVLMKIIKAELGNVGMTYSTAFRT